MLGKFCSHCGSKLGLLFSRRRRQMAFNMEWQARVNEQVLAARQAKLDFQLRWLNERNQLAVDEARGRLEIARTLAAGGQRLDVVLSLLGQPQFAEQVATLDTYRQMDAPQIAAARASSDALTECMTSVTKPALLTAKVEHQEAELKRLRAESLQQKEENRRQQAMMTDYLTRQADRLAAASPSAGPQRERAFCPSCNAQRHFRDGACGTCGRARNTPFEVVPAEQTALA